MFSQNQSIVCVKSMKVIHCHSNKIDFDSVKIITNFLKKRNKLVLLFVNENLNNFAKMMKVCYQ